MIGSSRFGVFELSRAHFQLTRNGHRVDLPRISMEVLLLLVERPGALISRAELTEGVWPGADPDEKVQGINTAVNRIRTALRDDPARPKYIETVIGKGYRFIAEIDAEPAPAALPEAPPVPLSPALVLVSAHEIAMPSTSAVTFSEPFSAPSSEVGRRARPRSQAWLGALIVVAAAAVTAWFVLKLRMRPAPTFALVPPVALTGNGSDNVIGAAGISPDGTRVVFADSEGLKSLGRNDLAPISLAPVPLQSVDHISWFPNGRQLVVSGYNRDGGTPEVWLVSSVTASQPARLLRSDARMASPSPDGSHLLILSGSGQELWETAPDGSASRLLLRSNVGETLAEPVWIPGGKLILLQRRLRPTEQELAVDPTAGSRQSQSTLIAVRKSDGAVVSSAPGVVMTSPCIFPDGMVLYITTALRDPLGVTRLDLSNGALLTPPAPVVLPPGQNAGALSVAPTGDIALLLHTGKLGVFVAGLADNGRALVSPHPLSSPAHAAYPHAWTPDSRSVLFEQERDDGWWLLQQALDRRDAEGFGDPRIQGFSVNLSPDHHWMLFSRSPIKGAPPAVFRVGVQWSGSSMTADAAHPPEALRVPAGDLHCPRTGKLCILRSKDAANRQVVFFALDPASGTALPLKVLPWADSNFGDWDVSPDGESVVLCSGPSQPGELRLLALRTGRERVLHFSVYSPFHSINWQAAGEGWFASTSNGDVAVLYKLGAEGTATPLRKVFPPTWGVPSPDGKSLAFVDLNRERNVWITRLEPRQ